MSVRSARTVGWPTGGRPGRVIVIVDVAATAVFVVSATVAATVFSAPTRAQGVAVSLLLFATGVVSFLWGYWSAVQRSRRDVIGVAALFFLLGSVAPRPVRRVMWGCLAVQVTTALVTALSRPETDGRPGSSLAFGILVPMLGLGLNGLWGAEHGSFEPRKGGAPPGAAERAD